MRWLTAGSLCLLLLLAGCSGDDDGGAASNTEASTTSAAPAASDTTGTTGTTPTGYNADVEQAFLEACTAGAGEDLTDVCQCVYDRTEAEVPFEVFQAFDAALTTDPTADIPPELVDVYTDCVLDEAPEGTTPTSAADS